MDTYFKDYSILANKTANALCDQIFGHIKDHFSSDVKFNDKFVLSGRLSKNLQDELENPINNVVFITEDSEIFEYYQANSKQISPSATGIVHFKKRSLIYFDDLYIEVWFSDVPIVIGKYEDLPVQSVLQIPIETL